MYNNILSHRMLSLLTLYQALFAYLKIHFLITIFGLWVESHVRMTLGLIYQALRPYFVSCDVVYIHLRLLEIQSDQPKNNLKKNLVTHESKIIVCILYTECSMAEFRISSYDFQNYLIIKSRNSFFLRLSHLIFIFMKFIFSLKIFDAKITLINAFFCDLIFSKK